MFKMLSITAAAAALALAAPAFAQQDDPHGPMGGGGHGPMGGGARGPVGGFSQQGFYGRAYGGLSDGERSHWAGGQWRHAWHNGVYGWWWLLDDDWYFYPEPIYPYPAYIGPVTPQYWYHCASPAGFYPDVPACPTGWQVMPASPPPDLAPPPPPPTGGN